MPLIPREADPEDDAAVRGAAKHEIEFVSGLRMLLLTEAAASTRWLLASLLATNGGAALGVLSADSIPLPAKIVSCALFAMGMLLALVSSLVGQRINRAALEPLGEMAGYWITVVCDGMRHTETEEAQKTALASSIKYGWVPSLIGFLSAGVFALGAGYAGFASYTAYSEEGKQSTIGPSPVAATLPPALQTK